MASQSHRFEPIVVLVQRPRPGEENWFIAEKRDDSKNVPSMP